MSNSARNKIKGKITNITKDNIMAQVEVDIGNQQTISSIITNESVNEMGLSKGDQVEAMIKSTSVMIKKK